MRSTFRRLFAVLALATLGAAACSDAPTGAAARDAAELGFALNVAGTEIRTLVVEVTAADIASRLVFNVAVQNGTASGTIAVPAGAARTLTLRAYDAQGTLTHEGSATVDVKPGSNPPVSVTLVARPGHLPITVGFGSYVVHVWTDAVVPAGGIEPTQSYLLSAEVRGVDGTPVPGAGVRWASADPSVATVTEGGWVTGHRAGTAEVVATYEGYGGSILVNVTEAAPAPDFLAPQLIAASFSPETMVMEGSEVEVTLSLQVYDPGSGVREVSADIFGPRGAHDIPPVKSCQEQPNTGPTPSAVWITCVFRLPWYAQAGTWTLSQVVLYDAAGNERWLGDWDLGQMGLAASMQIGNPFQDVTAPTLTGIDLGQAQVTAGGSIYVQAHTSDAVSGTTQVSIGFRGPDGSSMGCTAYPTGNPGTFGCTFYMSSTAAAGEWVLQGVMLADEANNFRNLDEAQLAAAGLARSFTVVR